MNKLIFLIVLFLGLLPTRASMSNPNQICFKPESGDSAFFGTSVAINDKYLELTQYQPKTLIKSLDTDATKVIDAYGTLSLDKNILAVMLPEDISGEQASFLRVFRLDENAVPHLITK